MLLHRLIEVCLYIFCACGFIYQSSDISINYFKYKVQTKIKIKVTDPVPIKDYSICTRFLDLIDSDPDLVDNKVFVKDYILNHTVMDTFLATPSSDTIIASCVVRDPNSFSVFVLNKTECYKVFKITRFIVSELICYEFEYRNRSHSFSTLQLLRSFWYARMIYVINVNTSSELNNVEWLYGAAYSNADGEPYESLAMAQQVYTKTPGNKSYNFFLTRYASYERTLLEPPYETNCYDYGSSSRESCIMICLRNKTIESIHEIPAQVLVWEELLEVKQVYEGNMSTAEIVNEIELYCRQTECSMNDCQMSFSSAETSQDFKGNRKQFYLLSGHVHDARHFGGK